MYGHPLAAGFAAAALIVAATMFWRPLDAARAEVRPGDANCDGFLTAVDAAFILQREAGLIASLPCVDKADVNGDGRANSLDASLVLQAIAGYIDLGPPEATPTRTRTRTPTRTATRTATAPPIATPTATTPMAQGTVSTGASTYYFDILGAMWVVGEVRNGLDHEIALVEVTANLYSASEVLLATDFGFACVTTIPAGGDSSYTVLVLDPPPGVDHVGVSVTDYFEPPFFTIDPPVVGLDATITNVYTDSIGFRHAVGTVTNNSAYTYDFVQPCVAFYDAAGNVVRTDFTFTSPSTLAPGQTGTFDAFVDAEGAGIVSQRLWVDADYE
jgi:hypothetical protein